MPVEMANIENEEVPPDNYSGNLRQVFKIIFTNQIFLKPIQESEKLT